jgi:hypothetical protein
MAYNFQIRQELAISYIEDHAWGAITRMMNRTHMAYNFQIRQELAISYIEDHAWGAITRMMNRTI